MSKPVLMDYSPPNTGKVAELLDFFRENDYNYYFVTMGRHPCMFHRGGHEDRDSGGYDKYAAHAAGNISLIPGDHRVHVLYEEAMLNPLAVAQQIVNRIPEVRAMYYGICMSVRMCAMCAALVPARVCAMYVLCMCRKCVCVCMLLAALIPSIHPCGGGT